MLCDFYNNIWSQKEKMKKNEGQLNQGESSLHNVEMKKESQEQVELEAVSASASRNRVWSQNEHLLYLIFLEVNKKQIKSKLVRHSNVFFRQMSGVVKSKTQIQCRSHHHKYEQKYRYTYRILKEEKAILKEKGILYEDAFSSYLQRNRKEQGMRVQIQSREHELKMSKKESGVSIDTQTDLFGVNLVFVTEQQFETNYLNNPSSHSNLLSPRYSSNYLFFGQGSNI